MHGATFSASFLIFMILALILMCCCLRTKRCRAALSGKRRATTPYNQQQNFEMAPWPGYYRRSYDQERDFEVMPLYGYSRHPIMSQAVIPQITYHPGPQTWNTDQACYRIQNRPSASIEEISETEKQANVKIDSKTQTTV